VRRKYGFMAQLSPKQYIQTKARSLPIYKTVVNKDWESARTAQVIVMRRHVNGNITAGVYLVDLLCLGIKDTMFIFNETQADLDERFGVEFEKVFEEVDYTLAHNIVYAGHDFALDFDIKPHADFAITKFILEDDSDAIPLIDIEVGQDDKPHLIVKQSGQFGDALAKLKKIAGEGNYYYTIASDSDDEDDTEDDELGDDSDDEDDDTDDSFYDMDEFDLGEITPLQARYIYTDDLLNEDKVAQRAANEIMTLQTEAALRTLGEAASSFYEHEDDYEGALAAVIGNEFYASGVTEQQQEVFSQAQDGILKAFADETSEAPEGFTDALNRIFLATLEQQKENPLVVANIFECAFFSQEAQLTGGAEEYLKTLAPAYPLAQLTLAFAAFVTGEGTEAFEAIYSSKSLADVYPDKTDFGASDIATYSLLQTLVSLGNEDLNNAIRNYYIAAETEIFSWMLPAIQVALADAVNNVLAVTDGAIEDDATEDSRETGDDEDSVDDGKPTLRIV